MKQVADNMTRRSFLKTTAAATAITAAGPMFIPKHVFGANDRIRVAVLGVHSRGNSHIQAFMELPNVEVTTLCDPDLNELDRRAKEILEKYNKKVKLVQDLRKVISDKNIDVISIASPNHWHSLTTIWACQAGKDVYVEKPMSHNIFEGRKAVEAARKYNRIVQHGTQSRSSESTAKEIAALQSGKYGKLVVSKGYCCKPRWSIGFQPIEKAPANIDFDIWLGPADAQPFHRNLVHYNWHWFWGTGNGDTGNQGVHQMDIARWAIPGATYPKSVWSLGGRFGYKDQGETPNTQLTVFDYGEVLLLFETRGLVGGDGKSKMASIVTNEYYTTDGKIHGEKFYPKNGTPEPLEDLGGIIKPGGNFGNFIDAVRSRKMEDLNADVLEGHYSSALCHLSNISYQLGDQVPFSKKPETLLSNENVFDSFQMIEKNMAWGMGLDLQNATYQLGRKLNFDAATEKFMDDEQANSMLTRPYREPYVVRETV